MSGNRSGVRNKNSDSPSEMAWGKPWFWYPATYLKLTKNLSSKKPLQNSFWLINLCIPHTRIPRLWLRDYFSCKHKNIKMNLPLLSFEYSILIDGTLPVCCRLSSGRTAAKILIFLRADSRNGASISWLFSWFLNRV